MCWVSLVRVVSILPQVGHMKIFFGTNSPALFKLCFLRNGCLFIIIIFYFMLEQME